MRPKVFFKKNGSTILTCVGAAGVVGTAVLTASATTKASVILAEMNKQKEAVTKLDKFKAVAPTYIPAVLVGAATISCIFGANVLNKKQQASMASAYVLLNEKYKAYRNKVLELYGDEEYNKVDEAIIKEQVQPRQ